MTYFPVVIQENTAQLDLSPLLKVLNSPTTKKTQYQSGDKYFHRHTQEYTGMICQHHPTNVGMQKPK
uniref:Uncharacterized protein n=1 Tax=Oryza rufipogon TaxID=4529 RepID=A0A0E0QYI6_ORYRU